MKELRLALLGFGTVGQWLAEALHTRRAWLQQEYGVVVTLISVGTAHHGLIYRSEGLDIPALLDLVATRQPLTAHPSVTHWTNVLEGLQATSGNVLAEATGATLRRGEPGLSYIRAALAQSMHVVTSSKGPMALAGLELLSLARTQGVQLRINDPLARIDGLLNAIHIQTDTPAEVTVIGPGAGRFQAGQGMLADLISIAKALPVSSSELRSLGQSGDGGSGVSGDTSLNQCCLAK